jgi:hypothetical protein
VIGALFLSSGIAIASQTVFCPNIADFKNGTVCPVGWDCAAIPRDNFAFKEARIVASETNTTSTASCAYEDKQGQRIAYLSMNAANIQPAIPANWKHAFYPGVIYYTCDSIITA